MKHFTATIAAAALGLALAGCGSGTKTGDEEATFVTSATTSTTSTTTSATSPTSTSAPATGAHYTIADYIRDNRIEETAVRHGDPGSPTIDLPVPDGWQLLPESSSAPYGGIVYTQPADPNDPPTIVAILSKLTGDVDAAKIIEFAPGELMNLPEFDGNDGSESTLSGFQAWQLGGSYTKNGILRSVAQKTVIIPAPDGVFVLQLDADALDDETVPLMDATDVIDEQTTITP